MKLVSAYTEPLTKHLEYTDVGFPLQNKSLPGSMDIFAVSMNNFHHRVSVDYIATPESVSVVAPILVSMIVQDDSDSLGAEIRSLLSDYGYFDCDE